MVHCAGQNANTATIDTKRTNATAACIRPNWGASRVMKQLATNPAESSSAWTNQFIIIALIEQRSAGALIQVKRKPSPWRRRASPGAKDSPDAE